MAETGTAEPSTLKAIRERPSQPFESIDSVRTASPGDGFGNAADAAGVAGAPRAEAATAQVMLMSLELQNDDATQRQQTLNSALLPFLNTYCVDCHGPDTEMAGIAVHQLKSVDQFLPQRKAWERVYRMINSGAMPPFDHDVRPEPAQSKLVAEFLYDELYNFDCSPIDNPGRSTIRRLNRVEYNNTVQDLFGITIRPADDFPSDDVGEGFDNIGDVLSLPPLLLEKYLIAAEQVAAEVIDTTDYSVPRKTRLSGEELTSSLGDNNFSQDFRQLNTVGSLFGYFEISVAGEYEITVEAAADQAGDETARFAMSVDDKPLQEFRVNGQRKPRTFTRKVRLSAGRTKISADFLNDFYDPDARDPERRDRNLGVRFIELSGPAGGGDPQYSEAHRRFVTARPHDSLSPRDAAKQVLKPLLDRIFRRPASDADVDRYAGLVQQTMEQDGDSYEQGLSLALQAALVAPEFLFRMEKDPPAGQSHRQLDDFELASRLSYFLWSTMPDDELFQLAGRSELHKPEVLKQQIRRMLRHDKSRALFDNFAAQWLSLRNLNDVTPNPDLFPDFSADLRSDMRRETELLFETIVREDRSVDDLLSADFTFVNGRLARHYGIAGVDGNDFVRVSLSGTNRAGVLTHASILTVTSNPGRTSPVKRGKWIMENIFGESPPPPPPGVPPLEATAAAPDATLRERLAKHREDPGCASCHTVMDPLGLGFENFDAVGRWRDTDGGKPVDAAGVLPPGVSFNGPLELIEIVKSRREDFMRTMAEKMLVYAIGRGTDYYDKCAVDDCRRNMQQHGNRFSAMVEGIVLSDPFLKRSSAVRD
ncbi:MAG: DUF1592 domain-containing protein [Planctomycetaceae bacterium]